MMPGLGPGIILEQAATGIRNQAGGRCGL